MAKKLQKILSQIKMEKDNIKTKPSRKSSYCLSEERDWILIFKLSPSDPFPTTFKY